MLKGIEYKVISYKCLESTDTDTDKDTDTDTDTDAS